MKMTLLMFGTLFSFQAFAGSTTYCRADGDSFRWVQVDMPDEGASIMKGGMYPDVETFNTQVASDVVISIDAELTARDGTPVQVITSVSAKIRLELKREIREESSLTFRGLLYDLDQKPDDRDNQAMVCSDEMSLM